ncbi:hypothetical protein HO173_008125 [Letharia columbiana]|uniref:Uncharacterized protein n=1 Tax=Letharia columbiana TaxID=112416 RepID=A0A8H6L2Z7_9LECA|nr:uncharacterized protein HO173_008125 [Letharia columbiana]KAF6233568.1 hypothetical protein HO173_008125 [Letharia columbiana]
MGDPAIFRMDGGRIEANYQAMVQGISRASSIRVDLIAPWTVDRTKSGASQYFLTLNMVLDFTSINRFAQPKICTSFAILISYKKQHWGLQNLQIPQRSRPLAQVFPATCF